MSKNPNSSKKQSIIVKKFIILITLLTTMFFVSIGNIWVILSQDTHDEQVLLSISVLIVERFYHYIKDVGNE